MQSKDVLAVLIVSLFVVSSIASADYVLEHMLVSVMNPIIIWDGTTTWNIDSVDGSGVTIDIAHHKIHDGEHYFVDHYDGDVDQAEDKEILIITPDDKELHMTFHGSTSVAALFTFFENATTSNNGTTRTSQNNYRNKPPSSTRVFNDSTISATGSELLIGYVGVGEGKKGAGASGNRENELILYPATYYLLLVEPTADDAKVTISLNWYEVDV